MEHEEYKDDYPQAPMQASSEGQVSNIVQQIDPATIVDNLDHALNGEIWSKESNKWVMNAAGEPLCNKFCRGFITPYVTAQLNNNTSMSTKSEKSVCLIMEQHIKTLSKEFVCNLERYGFVKPSRGYATGNYQNRGQPDSSRMTSITFMILGIFDSCYRRSINGMESSKIWKAVQMTDPMAFSQGQDIAKTGFFGGRK